MTGRRRFLFVVVVSVLAAFAFMRIVSHDGTSAAAAAETPEPPRLVTAPAEEIGFTRAKLVGSVNPHGSPTTYYFAWGTSYNSLPNKTPELSAGEGTHSLVFHEFLSGLEPGREYFFQLVATNGGGTSKGSIGHLVTLKDTTPPVVELSGPLTEGLKEGTTEYPLHVLATDGSSEHPGSGVRSIAIAVDGETVDTVEQQCAVDNCVLETNWTFNSETFPGEREITVTATDFANNVGTHSLELAQPDGAIPACRPEGGATTATPTEVAGIEGGGTRTSYALRGGLTYSTVEPPAGFNPLTASAEQLARYDYPPRPSAEEAQALEQWEADVTSTTAGGSVCSGIGSEGGFSGAFEGGLKGGEIWSGFTTLANKGEDKWNGAKAEFVQPEFLETPYCPDSAEYSWVGIGGFREEAEEGLIQIGTAIFPKRLRIILQLLARGGKLKEPLKYTFYFESKLAIEPKQKIYVFVEYNEKAEKVFYNVVDRKTGASLGRQAIEHVSPVFFQGTSAEFIDERPTFGTKKKNLANFHEIEWKGLGVRPIGKQTWPSPASFDRRQLRMKGQSPGAEALMAAPSNLSENGREFDDFWHACHP